jgi:hypothetical protein
VNLGKGCRNISSAAMSTAQNHPVKIRQRRLYLLSVTPEVLQNQAKGEVQMQKLQT